MNRMKTNKMAVRLISLLLLSAMLVVSFAACGKEKKPDSGIVTTASNTEEYPFLFDKTDYNDEVTFLHFNNLRYQFFFSDTGAADSTDLIESALFERDALVEQYLGVSVRSETVDDSNKILPAVETQIMSGINSYDAVLTHSYLGVTGLVSEGLLADFGEMDEIDLEADWWNYEALETLAVKGKMYFALNDFMISDPEAVFFNKDMLEAYQKEDPYELVRDGEWTMENLIKITADVYVDDSSENVGMRGKEDTYGFAAMADWPFLSLIDSCDVQWLTPAGSGYRALQMGDSNVRYSTLYDKIMELANAESTYLWNYNDNDNAVKITDKSAMFMFASLKEAYSFRGSEVRFGVLPYPKLDEDQVEYRSFDWSGMLCVPKAVDNMTMVEQTLDCIAYFATDTIRPAYYEKLLGTRLAESPDDAEMISVYIYGNIVLNPVFNYIEKATSDLGVLAYTVAKALRATLNQTQIYDITYNWNSYRVPAQMQLDKFLN